VDRLGFLFRSETPDQSLAGGILFLIVFGVVHKVALVT
jgi:hypothetical protein